MHKISTNFRPVVSAALKERYTLSERLQNKEVPALKSVGKESLQPLEQETQALANLLR